MRKVRRLIVAVVLAPALIVGSAGCVVYEPVPVRSSSPSTATKVTKTTTTTTTTTTAPK